MDVHARHGILDRAKNIAVIKLGEIARKPTLNAYFGRAESPRFYRLTRHVVQRVKVGVFLSRPAAECAELASHETDIGEVDVAVDDVGNDVARKFGAQNIRGNQQAEQVIPLRIGQRVRFFQRELGSILCLENFFERCANGKSDAGSYVAPIERGERLEFGSRKIAGQNSLRA